MKLKFMELLVTRLGIFTIVDKFYILVQDYLPKPK